MRTLWSPFAVQVSKLSDSLRRSKRQDIETRALISVEATRPSMLEQIGVACCRYFWVGWGGGFRATHDDNEDGTVTQAALLDRARPKNQTKNVHTCWKAN